MVTTEQFLLYVVKKEDTFDSMEEWQAVEEMRANYQPETGTVLCTLDNGQVFEVSAKGVHSLAAEVFGEGSEILLPWQSALLTELETQKKLRTFQPHLAAIHALRKSRTAENGKPTIRACIDFLSSRGLCPKPTGEGND